MGKYDKYISGDEGDAPQETSAPIAPPTSRYQKYINAADEPPAAPAAPPPAEMRSADYTPSERFGNAAQDVLVAGGMAPYNAGKITSGVGNILRQTPGVGSIPALADAGYYATSSDLPLGQRLLKTGTEMLGALPGGRLLQRAVKGVPQRAIAPTAEEVADAADTGYRALRSSPTRYAPDMANDVRNEISLALAHRNPEDTKRVTSGLDAFVNRKSQTGWTPNDFENLRKSIKGGATPAEIGAGQDALEVLDRYMANPPAQHIRVGSPAQIVADENTRRYARGNAAAGFRSDVIEDIAKNAEIKQEAGKDAGSFVRNKLDTLLTTKSGERKAAGFTDAERAQVRDTLAKTMTEKIADKAAGVTGQFVAAPLTSAGAIKGYLGGVDPITAGAAAAMAQGSVAGVGGLVKNMAGTRAQQALVGAEGVGGLAANLRMRSPLAQSLPSRFGFVSDPSVMASDAAQYLALPQASQALQQAIDERRARAPFPDPNRPAQVPRY